jgi:hypothetical protein
MASYITYRVEIKAIQNSPQCGSSGKEWMEKIHYNNFHVKKRRREKRIFKNQRSPTIKN